VKTAKKLKTVAIVDAQSKTDLLKKKAGRKNRQYKKSIFIEG
jgi:hypothetical protein